MEKDIRIKPDLQFIKGTPGSRWRKPQEVLSVRNLLCSLSSVAC